MLEAFLLAGLVLACLVVVPFLCGMSFGLLVTLAPGLKLKLRVAKLMARLFRVLGDQDYYEVRQELTRTVYARYGPKELRPLCKKVLEMTRWRA